VRMLTTLAAFIAGSVLGALHQPFWQSAPAFQPISLIAKLGLTTALALSLGLFAVVVFLSWLLEKRGPRLDGIQNSARNKERHWLRGPWPLIAGALGLALVNIATLLLAGRPWGVTSAFALWGSKSLAAIGVNVAAWPYWQPPANAAALR